MIFFLPSFYFFFIVLPFRFNMLFKSLIVAAICGLATAVSVEPVQALGHHQKHFKTPLGVEYKGSSAINMQNSKRGILTRSIPFLGAPIPISKKFLATKNVPFIPHPAGK